MEHNTILIVDDNALSRSILARLFEKDYTILEADNGKAALELLETHQDALAAVLLDLIMPEYDGLWFLEQLRSCHPDCTVPVICVTGDERESSLIRAYHLQVDDFVTKPFHADHVRRVVRSAIAQAGEQPGCRSEYGNLSMLTRLMTVLNRCCGDKNSFQTALELVGAYLGADRVSLYVRPFQTEAFQWRREGAAPTYRQTYRWMLDNDWCAGWSTPEEWMLYVGPAYGSYRDHQRYYDAFGVQRMQWLKIDGIREDRAYLVIENARRDRQDILFYAALQSSFSLAVKTVELGILDQKTGLYNRRLFTEYLQELRRTRVQSLGVIVMNLNSMHQYISIYGQAAGDELLERTAQVIRPIAGASCFRTGGDEFAAILRNRSREDTEAIMDRIARQCREQNIGLSLGCCWREAGIDPEEQFKAADRDMRQAKQRHYDSLNVTSR